MSETFRHTCRVEFRDTDAAGIVHFSVYFNYMEEAEHAFLRHLGLSVLTRDERGPVSWPRVAVRCDYRAPLRFDDDVDVQITIARLGSKSVSYDFVLSVAGGDVATGQVTAVCCRLSETDGIQSIRVPEDIAERMRPYIKAT